MPLVRHRDTLSDLIRKGGEHKSVIKNQRMKQSELMIRNVAVVSEDGTVLRSSEEITIPLRLSALFLYLVELPFVKFTRFCAIVLAFTIVLAETSGQRGNDDLREAIMVLEFICDAYYIMDGSAKLLSMFAYIEIVHNHMYHKIARMAYLRRSGFVDLAIAVSSLVYVSDSHINRWLHLVRCAFISLFYLEQLPQIDVLSSGISAGLTSTLYTWLLMTVTFLVYSAAGVIFFRENDPYHFGDLAAAMWTYFEMGTLDNWADVLNINYWGCAEYDAGYYANGTDFEIIQTEFGSLYLPVCWKPNAAPSSASLFFVSFVLICGFILVSLTVAFVTTGINTRLHELQREEDKEELLKEMGSRTKIKFPKRKKKKMTKEQSSEKAVSRLSAEDSPSAPSIFNSNNSVSSDPRSHHLSSNSTMQGHSKSDMTSEVKDPELLRQLLKQVWKGDDNIIKEDTEEFGTSSKKNRGSFAINKTKSASFFGKPKSPMGKKSQSCFQKRLLQLGLQMRGVVADTHYNYFIYFVIIFAAVLELLSIESLVSNEFVDIASICCQIVFTVDLMIKLASCAPRYMAFFQNSWNNFDLVLVVLLWIPVFSTGRDNYFELLKVLRIIRVLKMLSFIKELNVIIQSISTSARCLGYVVMFMLVFFFHFGAAGVFLFSKNDPFHFQDLGRAMLSLFQVSTLDNWGDIARMNMYGCRYIGYDPKFCNLDESKGYGWLAAWYFVIFVIVGVMVLVALFIGVIITSMELLHTSIHEEADMLKKVREKQAQFNITDGTCNTLLEIFDMIDVCANGRLTLHELKPVLAMVSLGENQQYELFHKIDEDASGKIDFAEFCELIKLMGEAYSANNPTTPLKENMTKLKILRNFGIRTRGILPFGSTPKKAGWGALTASAVTASALSIKRSNDENDNSNSSSLGLGLGLGVSSPTAVNPSAKQVNSLKRKSMMLTAARIESAKMEAEAQQKLVAQASNDTDGAPAAPEQSPAPSANSLLGDDRSNELSVNSKEPPTDAPQVSGAMASILKKKSMKAKSIKASHAAVDRVPSPINSLESVNNVVQEPVEPRVLIDHSRDDAVTPQRAKGEIKTMTPRREAESFEIGCHTPNNEEEKQDSSRRNVDISPILNKSIYDNINSPDIIAHEDVAAASFMRCPSDDSAVSNKFRSRKGNNSSNSLEKMHAMRKYRSGPIGTSGKVVPSTKIDDEVAASRKEPNLFFDYNSGCDDKLEMAAFTSPKSSSKRRHDSPERKSGRPSTRG